MYFFHRTGTTYKSVMKSKIRSILSRLLFYSAETMLVFITTSFSINTQKSKEDRLLSKITLLN